MDVQVHFPMFYLMFFKLTSPMTSCFRFCISPQPSGRCGAFKVPTVHFLRSAGSEVQQVQQVQQVQLHHPGAYNTLLKSFMAGTQTWSFGRWFCSFSNKWFLSSILIFQGFPIGWGCELHTKQNVRFNHQLDEMFWTLTLPCEPTSLNDIAWHLSLVIASQIQSDKIQSCHYVSKM